MRVIGCRTLVVALAMTGGACSGRPASPEPLFVLAAVSLSEALEEVGSRYTAATRQRVRFNFAASNILARQVREGIVADVLISADDLQMDSLAEDGLIEVDTRVPLVGNELAVVVRRNWTGRLAAPQDLLVPEVERIAIGDPAGVPAGVYARQYLERAGLWPAIASRLVPTTSVRAALAAVDGGHADAAMVYRTDVKMARHARVAFIITGPHAPRIVYPAAVLKASRQDSSARAFIEWLRTEGASAVFRRHGFMPAPAP